MPSTADIVPTTIPHPPEMHSKAVPLFFFLLGLVLLAAAPVQANKFCPGVPRRSLWSRLTEKEIIVTRPEGYVNTDQTPAWWLSDGKIANTSLSIVNDGKGLTESDGTSLSQIDKEKRWVPDCGTTNIVCGTLYDGIYEYDGVRPIRTEDGVDRNGARWHRLYYWYFQGTVGLAAPGGSGTWYPAHGCQKICMKGRMAAIFTKSGFRVRGDPNSNAVYCHYGYDLQEDINFYMQK